MIKLHCECVVLVKGESDYLFYKNIFIPLTFMRWGEKYYIMLT